MTIKCTFVAGLKLKWTKECGGIAQWLHICYRHTFRFCVVLCAGFDPSRLVDYMVDPNVWPAVPPFQTLEDTVPYYTVTAPNDVQVTDVAVVEPPPAAPEPGNVVEAPPTEPMVPVRRQRSAQLRARIARKQHEANLAQLGQKLAMGILEHLTKAIAAKSRELLATQLGAGSML